jgi:DNA topoisomerase-1
MSCAGSRFDSPVTAAPPRVRQFVTSWFSRTIRVGQLFQAAQLLAPVLRWNADCCVADDSMRRAASRSTLSLVSLLRDSALAAQTARLRHVSDNEQGFRRVPFGKRFRYLDTSGRLLRHPPHLERIRRLAIPPAWTRVWICKSHDGHIQATGYDARGRKQYRYHAAWRLTRDRAKYEELVAFGHALPSMREKMARHLAEHTLSRQKVLAAVVSLMQETSIRVGNAEYANKNGSFGLTTLLDRHAKIRGRAIEFRFRGKSGKSHVIRVNDPRLSKIVKRCRDIPGQRLFQYWDAQGRRHAIGSTDVNRYLGEISGRALTAKEFRTWTGTVRAIVELSSREPPRSVSDAKKTLLRAIESVASHLGNTASICRKCYIFPAAIQAHLDGSLPRVFSSELARARRSPIPGLSLQEAAVLGCLKRWTRAKVQLAA